MKINTLCNSISTLKRLANMLFEFPRSSLMMVLSPLITALILSEFPEDIRLRPVLL